MGKLQLHVGFETLISISDADASFVWLLIKPQSSRILFLVLDNVTKLDDATKTMSIAALVMPLLFVDWELFGDTCATMMSEDK